MECKNNKALKVYLELPKGWIIVRKVAKNTFLICNNNKKEKNEEGYLITDQGEENETKDLQNRTYRPFKYNKYTIFDLEKRFEKEQL